MHVHRDRLRDGHSIHDSGLHAIDVLRVENATVAPQPNHLVHFGTFCGGGLFLVGRLKQAHHVLTHPTANAINRCRRGTWC
jgi:hypothetical protein